MKTHTGIDIPGQPGEKVFAVDSGVVTTIGNAGAGWAQYAVLEHENKDYCSSYIHIDPKIQVGQKLKAGEIVGCLANISAPHLHFGIWRGPVNLTLTQRGALPAPENVGKLDPITDPAFPSSFIDPQSFNFRYQEESIPITLNESVPTFSISRDLKKDMSGPDIKYLQQILNKDPETRIALAGMGSPGNETESFGNLTEKAVQQFQIKYSIAKNGDSGFGIVGPKTRQKLAEVA